MLFKIMISIQETFVTNPSTAIISECLDSQMM